MRIDSKLCHITESKAVVQVNGWLEDKNLGSALGEGPTVEIAEDKAIKRLNKRIYESKNNNKSINSIYEEKINNSLDDGLHQSERFGNDNIKNEPRDWSRELTEIDLEIKRLKWSREDEIYFLDKTFGYNNRNKITSYSDIVKYLSLLKKIETNIPSKKNDDKISTLLLESDYILSELSWDHNKGREYLLKEFNVLTRKELNEEQLIVFVEKLKTILTNNLSH